MAAWRITRSLAKLRFSPSARWSSSRQQAAVDEGNIFDLWKEALFLVAIPVAYIGWKYSSMSNGPKEQLDDMNNAEGQKIGLRTKFGNFWQRYLVEDQDELQKRVDDYLTEKQQDHSDYLLLKSQRTTKRFQVPSYDFVKQMENRPVNRIE